MLVPWSEAGLRAIDFLLVIQLAVIWSYSEILGDCAGGDYGRDAKSFCQVIAAQLSQEIKLKVNKR